MLSAICHLIFAIVLLLPSLSCRTPDTTPPTVKWLSPLDGDTLYAGAITLKTEAHDNIEVTNVRFDKDGAYLDSSGLSNSDTFGAVWDATAETLDVGYTITATACDRAVNTATASIHVYFKHQIPPGALNVTTTPPGAAIWIDSVNTGKTTPATVESLTPGSHAVKLTLAHYGDVDTTIQVYGGQTAQLTDTLYGYAVVTGTITWQGHTLTSSCVALLDTSHDGHGAYILYSRADTATGAFTLAAKLSLLDSAYVFGFDDVDGNHYPSSGDGEGFWDVNGDHQMTTADMIPLIPGDTVTNAQVYLATIP